MKIHTAVLNQQCLLSLFFSLPCSWNPSSSLPSHQRGGFPQRGGRLVRLLALLSVSRCHLLVNTLPLKLQVNSEDAATLSKPFDPARPARKDQ